MTTNWWPGVIVLGLGLASAIVFLLISRRDKNASASLDVPVDSARDELNLKFQSLLDQRRALEAERHAMDPAKFAEESLRLEKAAADALRERDQRQASPAPAPARKTGTRTEKAPGWGARNPQLVGALWGGLVVTFFVVLGVLLMQEQKPREEGGTMTGKTPPMSAPTASAEQQPQMNPQFTSMLERARSNPEDLDNVGFVTHELMRMGMLDDASVLVERGLSLHPFEVELRVHRAVIASMRGEVTRSERELLHLIDTFPDAQEGLLFLAAMALEKQDTARGLDYLERYYVEVPPTMVPPQLVDTIHQLRAQVGR